MQTILLVFVHGFLGNEAASFEEFPQHLKEFLKKPEIDLKLYVYSTKGSNEEQIINFSDYLLLNILGYSHVFLLAHSMGGLISVDAYKFLMEHSTLSRDLINIKGILTFDSPFFGLDSSIVEIINVKHIKNTRILLNGSNLISGQQEVDIEVTRSSDLKGGKQLVKMTTSTETEVESLENLNDKEKFKKHFDNNVPTIEEILHYGENSQNNENNFTNLNFSAVASIAGSILSYFTPMPLEIRSKFRSKASKHVINFTEEAVHHLTFLTPLIELEEVKDNRIHYLLGEVASTDFFFKGYYLKVGELENRYFCKPPKDTLAEVFESIASVHNDPIEAHTRIFDSSNVTYINLLTRVGLTLKQLI